MSVGGARHEGFDDGGLRDVCCQACGAYVGSYEPRRAPRRALCQGCAARRLRDYWAAGWARPEQGAGR